MIKDGLKTQSTSHVVSPSADDWLMLNARITVTGEISGLLKDGNFFVDNKTVEIASIDLLSYGQTESHNHIVDGDSEMVIDNIISRFFEIPIVEMIYMYNVKDVDYIWFVLSEDADDIAFQLAVKKCELRDQYLDFNPEIRYVLKNRFESSHVPPEAKIFSRG